MKKKTKQIEYVLRVLKEIEKLHDENPNQRISAMREEAAKRVESEVRKAREAVGERAPGSTTIHASYTKQLGINACEFDRLVEEWLAERRLRRLILKSSSTDVDKAEVKKFFDS
jgi:hypothetical protein